MPAGGPVRVGIGRLRERLTWSSPVREKGDTGQSKITDWSTEYPVWALVESAAVARENYGHGQQFATATHAVTMRGVENSRAPQPTWRAIWQGRTLNVLGTLPGASGVNSVLVVYCQELLPTG